MDKANIEIEKLKQEINEIEEKIKKNEINKYKLSQGTNFLISEISNLNRDILYLNDAKEYSKIINKRLKIKLVILILFTLLSIFITIITISAIYKGFNVLPFLALFGASTFTSYLTINDYVDSKKEKKALDARDLDIHLNYAKKKLKRDTQILHKNQKHDKKTIEKLDLENSNLEERKKRKEERINELSILRNNVIKEFIRDNEKLDDTINIEYEKSNQKVKKINSDK